MHLGLVLPWGLVVFNGQVIILHIKLILLNYLGIKEAKPSSDFNFTWSNESKFLNLVNSTVY